MTIISTIITLVFRDNDRVLNNFFVFVFTLNIREYGYLVQAFVFEYYIQKQNKYACIRKDKTS